MSIYSVCCKESPKHVTEKITVAVSIYPVFDITRNIAGNRGDISLVIPRGANPHTYKPTPSQVSQFRNIDLYIGISKEFDGWMEKFFSRSPRKLYLTAKGNPHIWLSVRGARKISEKIAGYLAEIDQDNRDYYKKNLHDYKKKLDDLDKKITGLFESMKYKEKRKKFIQWHPAWDYFAREQGLKIIGTIQGGHGVKPSIKSLKKIIEKARKNDVRVIVIGLNVKSRASVVLAEEINGKIVRLDSTGSSEIIEEPSYINLMYSNAKILSEALNRQ